MISLSLKFLNSCLRTFIFLWLVCTIQTQIFRFCLLEFFLYEVSVFLLEHAYFAQISETSLEGACTLVQKCNLS